jgi:hypothetical protein
MYSLFLRSLVVSGQLDASATSPPYKRPQAPRGGRNAVQKGKYFFFCRLWDANFSFVWPLAQSLYWLRVSKLNVCFWHIHYVMLTVS